MSEINQNTKINQLQYELIEKYYPSLSKERANLRKEWSELNEMSEKHINWDNYLIYASMVKEINDNLPLPF